MPGEYLHSDLMGLADNVIKRLGPKAVTIIQDAAAKRDGDLQSRVAWSAASTLPSAAWQSMTWSASIIPEVIKMIGSFVPGLRLESTIFNFLENAKKSPDELLFQLVKDDNVLEFFNSHAGDLSMILAESMRHSTFGVEKGDATGRDAEKIVRENTKLVANIIRSLSNTLSVVKEVCIQSHLDDGVPLHEITPEMVLNKLFNQIAFEESTGNEGKLTNSFGYLFKNVMDLAEENPEFFQQQIDTLFLSPEDERHVKVMTDPVLNLLDGVVKNGGGRKISLEKITEKYRAGPLETNSTYKMTEADKAAWGPMKAHDGVDPSRKYGLLPSYAENRIRAKDFSGVNFIGTDAQPKKYYNILFEGFKFKDCIFENVDFRNCVFKSVDFSYSEITGPVSFDGAEIDAKTLKTLLTTLRLSPYRNLSGAKIVGDISGMDLSGLNLEGADFSQAETKGCRFVGSNLTDAVGITHSKAKLAVFNIHTKVSRGEVYNKGSEEFFSKVGEALKKNFLHTTPKEQEKMAAVIEDAFRREVLDNESFSEERKLSIIEKTYQDPAMVSLIVDNTLETKLGSHALYNVTFKIDGLELDISDTYLSYRHTLNKDIKPAKKKQALASKQIVLGIYWVKVWK